MVKIHQCDILLDACKPCDEGWAAAAAAALAAALDVRDDAVLGVGTV